MKPNPVNLKSAKAFSTLIICIGIAFPQAFPAMAIGGEDLLPSRIDPAGIKGTLLLISGPLPGKILEQMAALNQEPEQVLALQLDSNQKTQDSIRQLLDSWPQNDSATLEIQKIGKTEVDPIRLVQAFKKAHCVFLLGNERTDVEHQLGQTEVRQAIRDVLDSNGMIVCAGILAEYVGDHLMTSQITGLGLLPDACLTISTENDATAIHEDTIHYELAAGSTLIVKGRELWSDGDVEIHLPAGADRPARTHVSSTPARFDLTALRRSLRQRQGSAFPPKKSAAPFLENGTVIAIGGDGMPAGIIDEFVKRAGSESAFIIVLPTAMPDPIPAENRMADAFRRAGAGQVTVLPERTLGKVMSQPYQDAFMKATGIWFDGGRQWRFVDAYAETPVVDRMHDVLRRGGVIMGSSAGASIQAEYMARGNPLGNREIMAEGYERGFGFLPGIAIDQHFTGRNRFGDMSSLIQRYPQLLGIGIDGGTAIIVEGSKASVVGKGAVHFYDAEQTSHDTDRDYQSVESGGAYDLRERRVLSNPKSSAVKESSQSE